MYHSFSELEAFFQTRRQLGIKPGLERLYYMLEKLNHPERDLKTIHIAGTNGKGSTVAFIREGLMKNGYQVGSFVSPGIPTILDHIFINSEPIKLDDFLRILDSMMPIINEMDEKQISPTEYEILMVITLLYFKDKTDIVLIEAAMGGREDITNCVSPILTIITTISYDHMRFLGDTLTEIASHKAGIIKGKTPVIVGNINGEAFKEIEKEAIEKNAPIFRYGVDYKISDYVKNDNKQLFKWTANNVNTEIEISMLGKHQIENASMARMAFELLPSDQFSMDDNKWKEGLFYTKNPYRMEKIKETPLIYIDGAHNEAGIRRFVETVKHNFSQYSITIVFGVFKDKEIEKMGSLLIHYFPEMYCMEFDHPRSAIKLDYQVNDSMKNVPVITNNHDLLQVIDQKNQKKDAIFFVGSLHFVTMIKKLII